MHKLFKFPDYPSNIFIEASQIKRQKAAIPIKKRNVHLLAQCLLHGLPPKTSSIEKKNIDIIVSE